METTEHDLSVTQEILRWMSQGSTNDQILAYFAFKEPWLRVHPVAALRQSANHTSRHVPFDKPSYERLMNLIHVARVKHMVEDKKWKAIDKLIAKGSGNGSTLASIPEMPISRVPTMIPELDRVLGTTTIYDETNQVVSTSTGLGLGQIAYISGAKGVGKTTFYTDVGIKLTEELGQSVTVWQYEYRVLGQFVHQVLNSYRANQRPRTEAGMSRFSIRQEREPADICKVIKKTKPILAVFDSYDLIRGARTAGGIRDMVFYLKDAIQDHTSVFFIGHLNRAGTPKGANDIEYLCDATYMMVHANEPTTAGERLLPSSYFQKRIGLYPTKIRGSDTDCSVFMRREGARLMVLPPVVEPEIEENSQMDDEDESGE